MWGDFGWGYNDRCEREKSSATVALKLYPAGVKLGANSCFPAGAAFPVGFTGVICMITVN